MFDEIRIHVHVHVIAFNGTQRIQWCLEYQILVNDHREGRENGIMHMLPKQ